VGLNQPQKPAALQGGDLLSGNPDRCALLGLGPYVGCGPCACTPWGGAGGAADR